MSLNHVFLRKMRLVHVRRRFILRFMRCACKASCGSEAKRQNYTLLIARKKQIMAAVNAYDVYINGELLGRILNGQSLAARVFSDTITVEIRSAVKIPFMKLPVTRMTLKLKENPRIDFYVIHSGAVVPAVTGADVIEEVH